MTTLRLLSLDMAGTTVDESGTVYDVLAATSEKTLGRTVPADVFARWKGTSKSEALAGICAEMGAPLHPAALADAYAGFKRDLIAAYLASPPRPLAGVNEFFARMRERGLKIALQTGYDADVAAVIVDALGWQVGGPHATVDALVTSDLVPASRPAPFLIFRCMEATGVTSVAEVFVAGDTANDVGAGRNAGAGCVAGVLTGAFSREQLAAVGPDIVLESLAVADAPGGPLAPDAR